MNERTTRPGWTPRRLLSLLMALIMTLSLLPTAVFADDGDTTNDGEDSGGSGTMYTITYDVSGVSGATFAGTKTISVEAGKEYKIPDDAKAKLQDKVFVGWQISSDENATYDAGETIPSDKIAGNITLIPAFRDPYTFSVRYRANCEGTVYDLPDKQNVLEGNTVSEPDEPYRYGYDFGGWYTDEACTEDYKYDFAASVSKDLELFAKWTEKDSHKTYTVTFDGGYTGVSNLPATRIVKSGDKVDEPQSAPLREDYTFYGWYLVQENGTLANAEYDFNAEVKADITLRAKWTKNQVTITWPAQTTIAGVSSTTWGNNSVPKDSTVNFTITLAAGYQFKNGDVLLDGKPLGWTVSEDANKSTTYYFTFTADAKPATDGGKATMKVEVSTPTPKTFTISLPQGSGYETTFTNCTRGSAALTDAEGSTSYTFNYGDTFKIKLDVFADTKATLRVDGTEVLKDISGNDATPTTMTETHTADHDCVVTVSSKAIVMRMVIYSLLPHTSQYTTQFVENGQPATAPTAPQIAGYEFEGWYTSPDYKNEWNFENTVKSNVVLYGKLTANTYDVDYDANADGDTVEGIPSKQQKTHGVPLTLTAVNPTRTGYTFKGWALSATGPVAYQPGDSYQVDANLTLYAVWEKNTYTVTISSGAGYSTVPAGISTVEWNDAFTFTINVDRDHAAQTPTVEYLTDSTTDWLAFGDLNAAGPHRVSGSTSDNSSAHWTYTIPSVKEDYSVRINIETNNTYIVSFYAVLDDTPETAAFLTQSVEHGYYATMPPAPAREGYEFVGYYEENDTTVFPFNEAILRNTIVHAVYRAIQPQIKFVKTSGTDWVLTDWKHGTVDNKMTTETTNPFTIAYGDNVEFDLVIQPGYDYSNLSVAANGYALGSVQSSTDDNGVTTIRYRLPNVTGKITEITVDGITRKTITITYNDNGGYGGPVQQTVNYYLEGDANNGKISNVVPKREGYEFKGWSTDNNAVWDGNKIAHATGVTAKDIQHGADNIFTQDTVLYAVWQAKQTSVTLAVSDTIDDTAVNKAEYEGESVTLTATVTSGTASVTTGSVQFYRCTDADPDAEGAKWTLIDSKTVSGGTAVLTVATSGYLREGPNKDTYKAVFVPTEGAGYVNENSNTVSVIVKSTAISWKLKNDDAIDTDANKLTIKQNNAPVDKMTAGQVYTLELPAIYALDEQGENTKLAVNKDYEVTWQYCNDKGEWVDYPNAGSGDTVMVDAAYSQYAFRAVVTPVIGVTSHFTKAAKFNGAELDADHYETRLITAQTDTVKLQATTTDLTITGAENEGTVKIAGKDVATGLAQFEGQKVTLTAAVKETTDGNPAVNTGYVNFYRKGDSTDTLLNSTPVAVGQNGVATCEVEITEWNTGKTVTENKDEFYAVYEANATYDTSASWTAATDSVVETGKLKTVYIKSTTIKTPIIESELEGKVGNEAAKATTYTENLTGLLAGVKHTFTLRQTGAAGVNGQTADWSVVALDGRTVDAKNYTIQWITKTGDNEIISSATGDKFETSDNKFNDEIYVRLNPTGDMKKGEDSKKAIIGTKQDVTVTVTASDEIKSTPATDVYQLNDITLTATVAAAGQNPTMKPNGTVTFYYSVDDDTTWTKVGDTKDLVETAGIMTASITTDQLPVTAGTNTEQDVKITAVYSGDETFAVSGNYDETTKVVSAGSDTNGVTDKTVTVYSSVVYAGDSENRADAQSPDGITITANGMLKANEPNVTLTLGQVYTLDHAIDLSKLTYGTDYTVQWQILENAIQNQDKDENNTTISGSYADTTKWKDLNGETGMSYTGTMAQDAAYRAKITVRDTPIAQGSFQKVDQTIKGRDVYYSNVLVIGSGMATVTTNITTSANQNFNEEGIVSGETATIHVLASGAAKQTPISLVTVTIADANGNEVFTPNSVGNVNGYTSFAWDTTGVTPGYYTLTVTAESNNGYAPQTITRTLIVRDNAYSLTAAKESKVYNGKAQGIDWTLTGVDIEDALAKKSVVVYYYDKDGKMVEPTQAGHYDYEMYLPASAYWTELTHVTGTFTIEKRAVEVVDLVAQAKVYDDTTNANIQEIILNDSAVNDKGIATGNTGIIDGDSVYAIGTGYTSQATAGTATLGVKDVTLAGDDAENYTLTSYSYTEKFNIQRSQVKGAIVSGRTYAYTGKDIKLSASDIYLIDQAGNELSDYDVTYYYHNGDGVEKVDAMNKMGKYTVIARPEQNNYKGGATATVYVGTTDADGTLDKSAVSSLITISNTVKTYDGTATGVTVTATKGTATARYYYNNGTSADWYIDAPANAGRYLVKATSSTGDTAYGIYTVVKARPEFIPTTNEPSVEYTSGQYDGEVNAGFADGKSDSAAETYITYTGGTIQGVAYEAPTEVGKYIATVHVGETANYTAHEEQVAFEITPKELTITADNLQRWQYGAFPDMVASYDGLATEGVAADTSLRDVQIQPEFLFNEEKGGYTNSAFDEVGIYSVTVRNALARNYTVTYVGGTIRTTEEEPKAELAIHGMPDNGTDVKNVVYYGDTIQLYAYGYYKTLDKDGNGASNNSSLIEWKVSDASKATINEDGLLTVEGVGEFTVTLTRGSGDAAISKTINVVAKKQEVKVVIPAEDKVYNGREQTYTTANGYGVNGKLETIISDFKYDNTKRTNVGSQIVTGKVLEKDPHYQSETYSGLFTINVKDVTIKPTEANTTYGTPATNLTYTEVTSAGSDKVLTDDKAVSVADAYGNLDVYDGYEILAAGKENSNYNVHYQTKNDKEVVGDVNVNKLALRVSTGTLYEQLGMTSGSLNPAGKYPVNGAEVKFETVMGEANVRMYGEPNWAMDYELSELISGDTLADLADLTGNLVKFNYNIGADANVKYDAKTTLLTGKSGYDVDTDESMIAFRNYTEIYNKGTQNVYQRPVELKLRDGMTQLNAYKPTIMPNGSVDETALKELIINNLIVTKHNDEGGLAELLKHTIKDLNIQISYSVSGDTITVTVTIGNQNYYLGNGPVTVTVKVDQTKIVAKYGPLGWTSASVTMVGVDENGNETGTTNVTGDVWYMIYTRDASVADKYSNYKDKTPVRKVKMTKGSSAGVYIANYDRLPAGEYVMFAIAEGYTIIE